MDRHQRWLAVSSPLLAVALATAASAQCTPLWQPGDGIPGLRGTVYASTSWDPDGPGPATPIVVFGGQIDFAGNLPVNNIATWDPATGAWGTLGSGTDQSVRTLLVAGGDLIAGGTFLLAGDVLCRYIARWNGNQWSPLGFGLDGPVTALTMLPNGDLIAGGSFNIGPGRNVARWSGTSWGTLGNGTNGPVYALATLSNGEVVAGGSFTMAGLVGANNIARWNGTSWFSIGSGTNAEVLALRRLNASAVVVVGGAFTQANGSAALRIAQLDATGQTLAAYPGFDAPVRSITAIGPADFVVGGDFTQSQGQSLQGVARWTWSTGGSWQALGSGIGSFSGRRANALTTLANSDVIASGLFTEAGGLGVVNAARWNGSAWATFGPGCNGYILTMAQLANGDVIAAGQFSQIGTTQARNIARWNGSTWLPLGSGTDGRVEHLALLPNGDVVATGLFQNAGGILCNYLARWNGASWAPFGSGLGGVGVAVLALPNGDFLVGGLFLSAGGVPCRNVAHWNSALGTFTPMGGGVDGAVLALERLANGDLIAGGSFYSGGSVPTVLGRLARWSGSDWVAMGTGTDADVLALRALPQGGCAIGGHFTTVGGIPAAGAARWTGSSFVSYGSGPGSVVTDFAVLPNGDLAAAMGAPTGIMRWNGAQWSTFDGGLRGAAFALLLRPNGDLYAGGSFATAGPFTSASFARLVTPCPASVNNTPTACVGPAGPLSAVALNRPFVGSTFRSTATGYAANGLGLAAVGFTPTNIPLVSLHPAGQPNCALLTTTEELLFLVPTAGTCSYSMTLPYRAAFAGFTLHHQFGQLVFDQGIVTSVTTSNRLTLTIGML